MKRLAVLFVFAIAIPNAFAWGEKGHYLVNEAATLGAPNDLPAFFHAAYPELVWLAYDPDRARGGGDSLEAANPPDHFLDSEYADGLELPRSRYKFIALMESSGHLRRFGITNDEAGFLPWRIAELTELLTVQFRLWRRAHPSERAFIERDIIHTAGILGHFAGDAAQPLHATWSYNGWVMPNPKHYANDCEIHSRFETTYVSHALETRDVVPKVAAPVLRSDPFAAALALVRESNALAERVYQIDRDGGFDLFRESAEAKSFTADRIAAGASLLRDLWWSAWRNSATSATRARR
ncbi:MAG TPA: hypothetical protein VMU84_07760 [Thermoanaerobaculia bacterium]|nr:hypothetical protein [Thermoanaerobaculia bacterium]